MVKRVLIFLFAFLYLMGQFTVSAKLAYCKDVLVSVNFDLSHDIEGHDCCPDFLKKKGQDCCSDEVVSIRSLVDDHFYSSEETSFKFTHNPVHFFYTFVVGVNKLLFLSSLIPSCSAPPDDFSILYRNLLI